MASTLCFAKLSLFSSPPLRCSNGLRLSFSSPMAASLRKNKLDSCSAINMSPLVLRRSFFPVSTSSSSPQRSSTVTVYAAKGYKMKTHKASAKRFRVTDRGKIVRRRAGKQHLLAKKNRRENSACPNCTQLTRVTTTMSSVLYLTLKSTVKQPEGFIYDEGSLIHAHF